MHRPTCTLDGLSCRSRARTGILSVPDSTGPNRSETNVSDTNEAPAAAQDYAPDLMDKLRDNAFALEVVQEVVDDVPLALDTSNIDAIEAALIAFLAGIPRRIGFDTDALVPHRDEPVQFPILAGDVDLCRSAVGERVALRGRLIDGLRR